MTQLSKSLAKSLTSNYEPIKNLTYFDYCQLSNTSKLIIGQKYYITDKDLLVEAKNPRISRPTDEVAYATLYSDRGYISFPAGIESNEYYLTIPSNVNSFSFNTSYFHYLEIIGFKYAKTVNEDTTPITSNITELNNLDIPNTRGIYFYKINSGIMADNSEVTITLPNTINRTVSIILKKREINYNKSPYIVSFKPSQSGHSFYLKYSKPVVIKNSGSDWYWRTEKNGEGLYTEFYEGYTISDTLQVYLDPENGPSFIDDLVFYQGQKYLVHDLEGNQATFTDNLKLTEPIPVNYFYGLEIAQGNLNILSSSPISGIAYYYNLRYKVYINGSLTYYSIDYTPLSEYDSDRQLWTTTLYLVNYSLEPELQMYTPQSGDSLYFEEFYKYLEGLGGATIII